jgi:hypothetical protein
MDKRIKVRENKLDKNGVMPDFTIIYSKIPEKERSDASYEIISSFKKEALLIIEIHTELLSVIYENRTRVFDQIMEAIKNNGLDYRYKKLPPRTANFNSNIFKVLFQKQNDSHQVFFLIDEDSWSSGFIKKIPPFGVKYYFFDQNAGPSKILDELNSGIISDKTPDFFKTVIFDCAVIGQMGLFIKGQSLEKIKSLIG